MSDNNAVNTADRCVTNGSEEAILPAGRPIWSSMLSDEVMELFLQVREKKIS